MLLNSTSVASRGTAFPLRDCVTLSIAVSDLEYHSAPQIVKLTTLNPIVNRIACLTIAFFAQQHPD